MSRNIIAVGFTHWGGMTYYMHPAWRISASRNGTWIDKGFYNSYQEAVCEAWGIAKGARVEVNA